MSDQPPASYAKNDVRPTQPLRKLVQYGFLLLNVWIAYLFYRFVADLDAGIEPAVARPPGVEGYLPIGALVSLKHLFVNGEFNRIHPSGLVLFIVFLLIAWGLKKGFCSWYCPVGLFSEYLAALNKKLFPAQAPLPAWLDYVLRGIKYLLLTFFIWAIIFSMSAEKIAEFVYGDYNKMADIKMMKFFTDITPFAATVLIILVVLSVLIPYFWCRFLCPYGALLGFLSVFSPVTVQRNARTCIDCKACTKVCPALISVHRIAQVSSDECHACYKCVDVCPVKDTLEFKLSGTRKAIPGWVYAAVIVGFFVLAVGAAQLTGYWQNNITTAEYLELMPRLDELSHNRGL